MAHSKTARIFLSPPHMGGEEIEFVKKAFESNYIAPQGSMVDAFEREFGEYVGIRHCTAVSSGTAALHLALRQLGVGPGDEVFVSTLTFIGSAAPVVFEGATPVFIDCDRKSWNMNPELLADELERCMGVGRPPKAVIPTDLYGQCCHMSRILEICGRYEVPVVCDSAEAVGAKYDPQVPQIAKMLHAGKGARAAVFSFNGNKVMTTSGGGMLASDDAELIAHAKKLSQQAREDFSHYEHVEIGYNYRMSNVLAAIGRGQLRVIEDRVKRKREIFEYYRASLGDIPGISFMPEPAWSQGTRWLTVITVDAEAFGVDREKIRGALEAEEIEARPVWKPMHLQPCFALVETFPVKSAGTEGNEAPKIESLEFPPLASIRRSPTPCRAVGGKVAKDLFEWGLCLPSGTAMTDQDLDRITNIILSCRQYHGK